MTNLPHAFDGVVHGRTIELSQAPGLPEGQAVSVIVKPVASGAEKLPPGEGLRRAFGAWADEATELDEFLAETRRLRQRTRPEIDA
jgi:hypothetical protein